MFAKMILRGLFDPCGRKGHELAGNVMTSTLKNSRRMS
jgi:hypothetical protein